MTNDKLIKFVKRWRDIERRQADLDYECSAFARDLRAEFASDDKFVAWCEEELRLSRPRAEELLARVAAVRLVPDVETYNQLGGFRQITKVNEECAGNRRHKIEIITAAKNESKAISTVLRERRAVVARTQPEAAPARAPSAREDALAMAAFIASHCRDMPAGMRAIVERYVPSARAKIANRAPRASMYQRAA